MQPILQLMRTTFGLLSLITGMDAFLNLLANWGLYISPFVRSILPFSGDLFMIIVGFVEILIGIFFFSQFTILAAYFFSAWLILISFNLVLAGFYDIAVLDVVLSISVFCYAQLVKLGSKEFLMRGA